MTIRDIIHHIKLAIGSLYDEAEAEAIARMVVCNRLNIDFSQLVLRYDEEASVENLEYITTQLSGGRPVQYVLGEAEFCDLKFRVAEGVLIPRPETEEMVYRIIQQAKPKSRVLDVGTGSGAIAIALAHHLREAEVVAVDISQEALTIAKQNAETLGVKVEFEEADALDDLSRFGKFDIIVSNPPYIPQSDMSAMCVNVVDYEPHKALFVPDDDALKFYRSIADNARTMLCEGGMLWFEIYEKFGEDIRAMLLEKGYTRSEIIQDIHQKDRVVWATL